MSVYSAPVSAGGVSVLAVTAAKSGAAVLAKGTGALAATGGQFLQGLTVVGLTTVGVGKLLVNRGRGATIGAPSFD
jgi:hypothetical protein